tara:strand:- start:1039 stop:1281 length:243 start_codon:yes stop_codon:yes gene_type:complete
MSRELKHDEEHPCKCDERHAVLSNTDYEHVKRNYFERTEWYFCRNCDCEWKKVMWCVGQHETVVIEREPYEKVEGYEDDF